mmetsp:Transcript_30866/g.49486  ORF Transcript_30866/g.49486 Transcript_30866/m.49486 type:complete len:97 (-) Transcript_30866:1107-1397(-)
MSVSQLYAGLGVGVAEVEDLEYKEKYEDLVKETEALRENIKIVEEKNGKLENENEILLKNTCQLYETAKCEIQRKDRIIADLHAQIFNLRQRQQRK